MESEKAKNILRDIGLYTEKLVNEKNVEERKKIKDLIDKKMEELRKTTF